MQTSNEGYWTIEVRHFKTMRSKKGLALGVKVLDSDAVKGNWLMMAAEQVIRGVKRSVEEENAKR